MNSLEITQFLNCIYGGMESQRSELVHTLRHHGFRVSSGYYNGHYTKDTNGNYSKDTYPIPVISVEGLCDIEIGLSGISVSSKLNRATALVYDYQKLSA